MSTNQAATFSVLVTVIHDKGQGTSPSRIAEIVQCALEEGTSQSGSFYAAQVDAFDGIAISDVRLKASDATRFHRVLPLHGPDAA